MEKILGFQLLKYYKNLFMPFKSPASYSLFFILIMLITPNIVYSIDRLIVRDFDGNQIFTVGEVGNVFSTNVYLVQSINPGLWLDGTRTGNKGAYLVLDNSWLQVQRRGQNFGGFESTVMAININAPDLSFNLMSNGNLGLGHAEPTHPLHLESGAYCSAGGVWTDGSSREYKKDIKELSTSEALATLDELKPVKFKYKLDPEDYQLGFIAEDAPELVATKDRKGMSPMDIAAVLTKALQEQRKIAQKQQKTLQKQQEMVAVLNKRIEELEKALR